MKFALKTFYALFCAYTLCAASASAQSAQNAPATAQPAPATVKLAPDNSAQQPPVQFAPNAASHPSPEEIAKQKEAQIRAQREAKRKLLQPLFAEIKPQTEKLSDSFFDEYKYHIASAAAALCIAVLIAAVLLRKKQKKLSPFELARLRLDALQAAADKFSAKDFALEASQIARDYIDQARGIPAPERTTEEFLKLASSAEFFDDDAKKLLAELLELADIAKFANHSFADGERAQMLANVRSFVESDNASIEREKAEKTNTKGVQK